MNAAQSLNKLDNTVTRQSLGVKKIPPSKPPAIKKKPSTPEEHALDKLWGILRSDAKPKKDQHSPAKAFKAADKAAQQTAVQPAAAIAQPKEEASTEEDAPALSDNLQQADKKLKKMQKQVRSNQQELDKSYAKLVRKRSDLSTNYETSAAATAEQGSERYEKLNLLHQKWHGHGSKNSKLARKLSAQKAKYDTEVHELQAQDEIKSKGLMQKEVATKAELVSEKSKEKSSTKLATDVARKTARSMKRLQRQEKRKRAAVAKNVAKVTAAAAAEMERSKREAARKVARANRQAARAKKVASEKLKDEEAAMKAKAALEKASLQSEKQAVAIKTALMKHKALKLAQNNSNATAETEIAPAAAVDDNHYANAAAAAAKWRDANDKAELMAREKEQKSIANLHKSKEASNKKYIQAKAAAEETVSMAKTKREEARKAVEAAAKQATFTRHVSSTIHGGPEAFAAKKQREIESKNKIDNDLNNSTQWFRWW